MQISVWLCCLLWVINVNHVYAEQKKKQATKAVKAKKVPKPKPEKKSVPKVKPAKNTTGKLFQKGRQPIANKVNKKNVAIKPPNNLKPTTKPVAAAPPTPTQLIKASNNGFKIVFKTNGGPFMMPVMVKPNGTIKRPEVPVKKGHEFVEWTTDPKNLKPYSFGQPITQPLTLYAKWKKINTHLVRFLSAGGYAFKVEEVPHGKKANLPAGTPGKAGHTFVNWTRDTTAKKPFDFNTPINQDVVVQPTWKVNIYDVKFETRGGGKVIDQHIPYQSKVKVPRSPVRKKFLFAGWFLDSSFSTPYDFSKPVQDNLVLYADWKLNDEEDGDSKEAYRTSSIFCFFCTDAYLFRGQRPSMIFNFGQSFDFTNPYFGKNMFQVFLTYINSFKNGYYVSVRQHLEYMPGTQFEYEITNSLIYPKSKLEGEPLNAQFNYADEHYTQRREVTAGKIFHLTPWGAGYMMLYTGVGVGSQMIVYSYNKIIDNQIDNKIIKIKEVDFDLTNKFVIEAGMIYQIRFLNIKAGVSSLSPGKHNMYLYNFGLGFTIPVGK